MEIVNALLQYAYFSFSALLGVEWVVTRHDPGSNKTGASVVFFGPVWRQGLQ